VNILVVLVQQKRCARFIFTYWTLMFLMSAASSDNFVLPLYIPYSADIARSFADFVNIITHYLEFFFTQAV